MKIGLLGYGTVGGGVALLAENMPQLEIKKVLVRSEKPELGSRAVYKAEDIFGDEEIDTVIEVIGGISPAYEYVKAAMLAGKNVVSANKALLAAHGKELSALAYKRGVRLRCSAAVGGGIGFLPALERCRKIDKIEAVGGILNGTSNFILSAMTENHTSFTEILKQAQALGFAEADPTDDIEGFDTRRKLALCILAAFDLAVSEQDIPTCGISSITQGDIRNFGEMGYVCKLLARAGIENGKIRASVEPTLVSAKSPHAAVPGNYNRIFYDAEKIGRQAFYGQGAGRYPTAYNVLQDCLDLAYGAENIFAEALTPASLSPCRERRYYVRSDFEDGWLSERTAQYRGNYLITKPISPEQMHAWAKARPQAFFAALGEEG